MIDLNLAAALPETFLAVAAMILLLLGVFKGRGATALVLWLSVACLALAFVIVAASMGRQEMALGGFFIADAFGDFMKLRSEEHTSELQSLMRTSYAVLCLKKKQT